MSDVDTFAPITELSAALANGSLTSERLVGACLERIERLDATLHAFVRVNGESALVAARAADLARDAGHVVGPLHGIPIAIKDIVDIEGEVTTGGSAEWLTRVSGSTATLVRRLKSAGMIVIGKTHTVEFAMGGWGTNTHMGTPRNPWDMSEHRAPGGSSSGSGVAVAAGLAPIAIGTDTGGSVRLPSVWNGLTGLKTTVGRVPCTGVLPLSTTLDTPGPLAHSAADAAAVFGVLASAPEFTLDCFPPASDQPLTGRRLGVLPEHDLALADEPTRAAFEAAVETLRALGASIEPVSLPEDVLTMGMRVGQIIGMEGFVEVGHLTEDPAKRIDPDIRPRIGLGRTTSSKDYIEALRRQQIMKAQAEALTDGFDAVLCPGTTGPAPAIAGIDQGDSPAIYTRFVNLLEWCALSLPCGTVQGLPVGIQVACQGNHEWDALAIGHAFQQHTDWHQRRPAL